MIHDKILPAFAAACVCTAVLAQSTPANAPADAVPRRSLLNRNIPGDRPGMRSFGPRRLSPRLQGAPARNAPAQTPAPQNAAADVPMGTNGVPMLAFNQAPLDIVLDAYAQQTGKTILPAPDIPKTQITLKSQALPSKDVYLEAIETILTMNGVTLEPYGDNFVKALPTKTVRTHGTKINMKMPDSPLPEKTHFVSQMITLQYLSASEAQKALEGFKDPNGLFQVFERSNTILVTDKQENINRMIEIVKMLDVKTPLSEEVFEREIKYASAQEIKTVLESIVNESQKEENKDGSATKTSGMPGFSRNRPSSGISSSRPEMVRPFGPRRFDPHPPANAPANTPNETLTAVIDDAARGAIRGKVQIISDERSNKLIVITRKENMDFFDKVIAMLDIETQPEVRVELVRLRHADAKELADQLNNFISNSGSSSSGGKSNQRRDGGSTSRPATGTSVTRTTPPPTTPRPATPSASPNSSSGGTRVGEISKEDTKILADERTRSLLIMARSKDMPILLNIIKQIDIKVSQVLLETMILQVQLSDEITTGIDWVAGLGSRKKSQLLDGGSGGTSSPIGSITRPDGDMAGLVTKGAGGLNYMALSKALDLGAIINAAKTDSRTTLVASPIIMTVDNKEATIKATKMRYLLKGYTYSGSTYNGSAVPDYEQKEIGLTVKVTPRINPDGTVMLTVEEEFSALGEKQTINAATGGTTNINGSTQQAIGAIQVETTVTRQLSADVTVDNRQTIILGGLTQTEKSLSESGIPILKDIPWIGKYLFGSTEEIETRQELLMFITPYVLDDSEAALVEARRRKNTLSVQKPWADRGWSGSPLADPVSLQEQLKRKKDEWESADEENKIRNKINEAEKERAEELKKRAEKDGSKGDTFWKIESAGGLKDKEEPEKKDEKKEEAPQQEVNLLGSIKGEPQK